MNSYAMIPVHKETKEILKTYGAKGESYDMLIRKLLTVADHSQLMETHYQRLKEKSQFIPLSDL